MIGPSPPNPRFSIIVPIGPGREPLVLASIEEPRDASPAYEVVVEHGPNPSRNRNRAVRRARAEILAFTDDDCAVATDWLATASAFFRDHPDYDAVGGPQLNLDGEAPLGRAIGYALGSPFGSFRTYRRFRRIRRRRLDATQLDLTSANLFLTRRAFEKWGPFDEHLWPNEETALLRRIELGGGKIGYDPSIAVAHKRRGTPRALARQCFGYGRGRARQTRSEGFVVPATAHSVPCCFLAYLALLPLAPWWPLLLVPLAAYLSASVAVSISMAWRERDAAAALMPIIFAIVHVGYPAGLIAETFLLAVSGLRRRNGAAPTLVRPPAPHPELAPGARARRMPR